MNFCKTDYAYSHTVIVRFSISDETVVSSDL